MKTPGICDGIARIVTKRPGLLAGGFLSLVIAAVIFVSRPAKFDSEILNLLPPDVPAVSALGLYHREFSQSRELAFFFETPGNPALLEDFREHFSAALVHEPWVLRFMDAPPVELPRAHEESASFFLPLLLNLPTGDFDALLNGLTEEEIVRRFERLAPGIRAGRPTALFEWQFDPLGIFAEPARRLSGAGDLRGSFRLTSSGGDAQVVSVITRQESLSEKDCRALMARVREFMESTRSSFGPDAPDVWVTGRAAYVVEIADSMRNDIIKTTAVSLAGILIIFFIAYRLVLPFVGMLVLLPACSLLALASGMLLFGGLNLVAIAFCSILFGLGNDFGLLLLEQYQRTNGTRSERIAAALRGRWPGIAGVAATTALGFLALVLSRSEGFAQLGVLTALGILYCAVFLPLLFFLFVRGGRESAAGFPSGGGGFLPRPRTGVFWGMLFAVLCMVALIPWRPVRFDSSPRSLEPRGIPAAMTLEKMLAAFPDAFEPVLVVLREPDPARAAGRLWNLQNTLELLRADGVVNSFTGASPFALNPETMRRNRARLSETNWEAVKAALVSAAKETGIQFAGPEQAPGALQMLQTLSQNPPDPADADWRALLPPESPWWFLVDRMVSPGRDVYLLYIRPAGPGRHAAIADALGAIDAEAMVTGWGAMLEALLPWAHSELRLFLFGVGGMILVVLMLYYRNARAWFLHFVSLLFSAGILVCLLKVFDVRINLLNVLALPLLLGVGVDYSTHFLLAGLQPGDRMENLRLVFKPVLVSGLTTAAGFGALALASNPALGGLGMVCALGILSCLAASILFVLPLCSSSRVLHYRNEQVE